MQVITKMQKSINPHLVLFQKPKKPINITKNKVRAHTYREALGEQLHHRGQLVLRHTANATVELEVLLGRQQLVNGVELGRGGGGGVSMYVLK